MVLHIESAEGSVKTLIEPVSRSGGPFVGLNRPEFPSEIEGSPEIILLRDPACPSWGLSASREQDYVGIILLACAETEVPTSRPFGRRSSVFEKFSGGPCQFRFRLAG